MIERRVFVSVNANSSLRHDARRLAVKQAILARLIRAGYSPQIFFEAGTPLRLGWSFENVSAVLRSCVGALVIGFPRWRASSEGETVKMVGEFIHFEGATALALGLPTLIAAEPDVLDRGIVYKGGGLAVAPIPSDATETTILTGDFGQFFDDWLTRLGARRDVFLGFCSKAAGFAAQVEQIVTRAGATVHNWAMDFGVGTSILEEIESARARCLRAIFVFSEDDQLEGTVAQAAPRDNVIFEAGYFIATKGAKNCVIIRIGNAKMPADLGGAIYLSVPTGTTSPSSIEARLRDFVSTGVL